MRELRIPLCLWPILQPCPTQTGSSSFDIPFVYQNASTHPSHTQRDTMRSNTFFLSMLPALALAAPQHTQTRSADASCEDLSCSTPPPSNQVRITNVQSSGTGCRTGTASVQISKDGSTVTIGLQDMRVSVGGEKSSDDKNCQIHTILQYPGGYQFSVMTATYNGYAKMDPGVTGTMLASYFFSQNPSVIV